VNKFGLTQATIDSINKVFSKYPQIDQAILYGSRAKGNFREGSDIDISLKGKNLTLDDLLKIETLIDDLLLPYKVDLSIYHLIENPEFIDHINRIGVSFK
jgi:predicted nucleotidyltransferase